MHGTNVEKKEEKKSQTTMEISSEEDMCNDTLCEVYMMMMMMLRLVYEGLGNSLTLGGCPLLRRQPDLHHLHTQYSGSNFLQASLETARITSPFSKIPTSSLNPSSTTALQYIHPPANIALDHTLHGSFF